MPMITTLALALVLGAQQNEVAQPPSDAAQLQTWYKIGDKGNELDFKLDQAKIDHYVAGKQDNFIAGEGEKLMSLSFSVRNPQKRDMSLAPSTFSFMASADDENFEFRGYLLNGVSKARRTGVIEPGEVARCMIVLPAKFRLDIVRLRIKRGEGAPVRYNLTGKMAPLISQYAYANGKTIMPRPNTTDFRPGTMFDIAPWRVKFDGMEYTSDKIKGYPPSEGKVYLKFKFTFYNMMELPVGIGFQYLTPQLVGGAGKEISWNHTLMAVGSDEGIYQELQKAGYVSGYYYFEVPQDSGEMSFVLTDNNSKRCIPLTVPPK